MQPEATLSGSQRTRLWEFVRGDTEVVDFEAWLYHDETLDAALGNDMYLELVSCDFANKEEMHFAKEAIISVLEPGEACHCASVRNLDAIDMGGDGFDEKFFSTLHIFAEAGPERWWLYAARCSVCGTNWLVAQEERIHDVFYVERLTNEVAREIKTGEWPDRFQTFADVLDVGVMLDAPKARFADPMAGALQATVEELLQNDPQISSSNIGTKLGISPDHAECLMVKVKSEGADPTAGFFYPKRE